MRVELHDMHGHTITPEGCAACGVAKRAHPQLWVTGTGWHTHISPNSALIGQRARALRAARDRVAVEQATQAAAEREHGFARWLHDDPEPVTG